MPLPTGVIVSGAESWVMAASRRRLGQRTGGPWGAGWASMDARESGHKYEFVQIDR
jgi:hypothetical protein